MKINIKLGCDCVPSGKSTIISEVDQKKNNMLYAPPEKDTKKKINQPNPNRQAVSEHKSRVNKNDEKYK